MDHVVYLDAKAGEMENILNRTKTMIIRGATGRKMPYGRVNKDDVLYFINNNAERLIKARAIVSEVINSGKMDEVTSVSLVKQYQGQLQLTDKQMKKWAEKRYIVLVGIKSPEEIEPFAIDKSNFSNMDDWMPVEEIQRIKL